MTHEIPDVRLSEEQATRAVAMATQSIDSSMYQATRLIVHLQDEVKRLSGDEVAPARVSSESPVSLDDLKRAISLVPGEPSMSDSDLLHAHYHCVRADAWRTAHKWHLGLHQRSVVLHHTVNAHLTDHLALDREEDEGMALIAEKLR